MNDKANNIWEFSTYDKRRTGRATTRALFPEAFKGVGGGTAEEVTEEKEEEEKEEEEGTAFVKHAVSKEVSLTQLQMTIGKERKKEATCNTVTGFTRAGKGRNSSDICNRPMAVVVCIRQTENVDGNFRLCIRTVLQT